MSFPCEPVYHLFEFRSVFHPWLNDLLLGYFQNKRRTNKRRTGNAGSVHRHQHQQSKVNKARTGSAGSVRRHQVDTRRPYG